MPRTGFSWNGSIAETERGERGFGYDSLFIPADGDGRTFSEMTEDDKNQISHRGRAFRALVQALPLALQPNSPST